MSGARTNGHLLPAIAAGQQAMPDNVPTIALGAAAIEAGAPANKVGTS
jgi:hypothetical protein